VHRLLIIYEGAADEPCDELEGATPLEIARSAFASRLMARGRGGLLEWTGENRAGRLENALGLLLGIAPEQAKMLRRGPVEAAGTDAGAMPWTYACRGNFVTADETRILESRVRTLSLDETTLLAKAVGESQSEPSYRIEVTGPGAVAVMFDKIQGKLDAGHFPEIGMNYDLEDGGEESHISRFMRNSARVLEHESINHVRVDLGENPASILWLWGGGGPSNIGRPFIGAPLKAAMVSNSPLAAGMARLCGMKYLPLGDLWSEEQRPELIQREEFINCIASHELTVIYVEAPGERGAFVSPIEKVKGLDRIDVNLLGLVNDALAEVPGLRLALTALPAENHLLETTPMLVCGERIPGDSVHRWDEKSCAGGAAGKIPAYRCLSLLLGD
jgi:2,3-bisphosphoglycerate-independent phosphoglycerate mutase